LLLKSKLSKIPLFGQLMALQNEYFSTTLLKN